MIGKFMRELHRLTTYVNTTRYNYACRAVIAQDPTLRIDQVKLPYTELVICLQQQIENILMRSYNISPSEAYDWWKNAIATYDERIGEIINMIIKSCPNGGIPVIINRNPTIGILLYKKLQIKQRCNKYKRTTLLSL
jgi:DNA-directed RNA polymerase beta' subunit